MAVLVAGVVTGAFAATLGDPLRRTAWYEFEAREEARDRLRPFLRHYGGSAEGVRRLIGDLRALPLDARADLMSIIQTCGMAWRAQDPPLYGRTQAAMALYRAEHGEPENALSSLLLACDQIAAIGYVDEAAIAMSGLAHGLTNLNGFTDRALAEGIARSYRDAGGPDSYYLKLLFDDMRELPMNARVELAALVHACAAALDKDDPALYGRLEAAMDRHRAEHGELPEVLAQLLATCARGNPAASDRSFETLMRGWSVNLALLNGFSDLALAEAYDRYRDE